MSKYQPKKQYKKVLVLPDVHAPWVDWYALKKAKKWYDEHQPDLVIQLGDMTDQKIWSRWPADVDDWSPSQEFEQAEKVLLKMHEWFPKMVILQGNHDTRIKKRAVEAGIPSRMFSDIDEVFNYSGWTWVPLGTRFTIQTHRGPVLFMHGDEMGGTVSAKARLLGCSVIQGHTHKASITYTKTDDMHIFGAEMGCIMDIDSKAARYAQANPVGVSVGFGVLKHGVPYFITCDKGIKV
jgi:predicted phosphodiesterase